MWPHGRRLMSADGKRLCSLHVDRGYVIPKADSRVVGPLKRSVGKSGGQNALRLVENT